MNKFTFTRGDFFGGLTAGIVALPLALAFGVQSGMGAAAGLYGAIFLGFFAALFGGTPSQISGPTGPMTVVTAATVLLFVSKAGSVENAITSIIVCFILAGVFQILMGIFKIGTLIKFIPYPVISGFMSGIGVIIILLQIFPAVGLPSPKSTVAVIKTIGDIFTSVNIYAFLYSVLTIAIIYIFPKVTKVVPSTLVALLIVTILSIILGYDVPVIGSIPEGFPPLQIKVLSGIPTEYFVLILKTAITLAALGAIDSLLTSVVADNVTKTKHRSNKELIGQGIGNSVAAIFGGIPGAGATMRTLVNIRSGGRNRFSGVIHSLVLLIVLLGAGKYAALIPNAVLAGILITVGIGILDYRGFRHVRKVPKTDTVIMIIVLFVTVFLDLLIAVGIGMVLAAIFFMKKMSTIVEERTQVIDFEAYLEMSGNNQVNLPPSLSKNVIVKSIDGPLFFGFASGFQNQVEKLSQIKYVVIRMSKVPFIDQTGLYALEDAILSLEQRNIEVILVGLQKQPEDMLRAIKIVPDLISDVHIFQEMKDATDWLINTNNLK